jgi:hypothetical protein
MALEWMKKKINAATKEQADGCTCVLLMDGHSFCYILSIGLATVTVYGYDRTLYR